jgi:hypothetical protein
MRIFEEVKKVFERVDWKELSRALRHLFTNKKRLEEAKAMRSMAQDMYHYMRNMSFVDALIAANQLRDSCPSIIRTPYRARFDKDGGFSVYGYAGDYLGNANFFTQQIIERLMAEHGAMAKICWAVRVMAYQTHLSATYAHTSWYA